MFSQLGPLGVDCDAPPYAVVQACARLGFYAPLDVRWCRMRRSPDRVEERASLFSLRAWKQLFALALPRIVVCTCGHRVGRLRKFRFVLVSRKSLTCIIGQCPRCTAIHWEEA